MKIDRKENWGLLLRYLALWNFVVSYPLYSVLTKSTEFFVAHRADWVSLSLFIAATSIVPPAALAFFEVDASNRSMALGRTVALSTTYLLVVLGLLQLLNQFGHITTYCFQIYHSNQYTWTEICHHQIRTSADTI